MECKDKFYTGISIRRLTGINRNIVECKGGYIVVADDNVIVLIETLWNVKRGGIFSFFRTSSVLIETLWNVKIYSRFPSDTEKSY